MLLFITLDYPVILDILFKTAGICSGQHHSTFMSNNANGYIEDVTWPRRYTKLNSEIFFDT